jgi:hypothetical protein
VRGGSGFGVRSGAAQTPANQRVDSVLLDAVPSDARGGPAARARHRRWSRGDSRRSSARVDGACIVEGLFDVATIATMRRAVRDKAQRDADSDARPGSASQGYIPGSEALTESAPDWIAEFVGVNTVRFSSLGKISGDETRDAYFRMLDNALYKSVADAMLLPFAGTYWVNTCVIQSFCCLLSAALLSALRSARLCSASLDLALQRSAHT